MATCPAGHDSATSDYCDVCGARMHGTAAAPPAPPEAPSAAPRKDPPSEPCPQCGTARTGRFCECCGNDFTTGAVGSHAAPNEATPGPPAGWTATVVADRAYYDAVTARNGPDAPAIAFPPYCPDRIFPLPGGQIRIGRRNTSLGLNPEIDLTGPPLDPGISHLHAALIAQPDGGWHLADLGSTNGTLINDTQEPIEANLDVPVGDGDRIHIGAWTTITLDENLPPARHASL